MSDEPGSIRADQLMSALISDPTGFNKSGLGNDLLAGFLRGYPLDRLQSLLRHQDAKIVKEAIWIASELPCAAADLLDDAIAISKHLDRRIRYFALDVIVLGTRDSRREEFVRVVAGSDDPDLAVADHAVFLISRATEGQLTAAIGHLELREPTSPHLDGLRAMLKLDPSDPTEIKEMLESGDARLRKYGLAAAERAYDSDPEPLEHAANSKDDFIRSLAAHLLKQHRLQH